MELLRRKLDLHHEVVISTFQACEHTVVKEVITDRVTPLRTVFRLHLDTRTLESLSPSELMRQTRSFPTLSALCRAFGIAPARAAFGLGPAGRAKRTPVRPTHARTRAHATNGRFTPNTRTHASA